MVLHPMLGKFIMMFNMVLKTFNCESTWLIVQWSLLVLKRWNYSHILYTFIKFGAENFIKIHFWFTLSQEWFYSQLIHQDYNLQIKGLLRGFAIIVN